MTIEIISRRQRIEGEAGVYYEPAVGRCLCGAKVELHDPLDNTCERCGRNYNACGQEVLHSRDPRVEEPYDYDY